MEKGRPGSLCQGPTLVILSVFLTEKEKPSEFQSMTLKKGQNSASVLHMTMYHGMV